MVNIPIEFEWDVSKELINVKKHSVTFLEAVETFFDPSGFKLVDYKHSSSEERFYWVGRSMEGHILTTRFTQRGTTIRIIGSAERRKFKRIYYEATKA